jgi:flagellar biogenesis protein FliO
LIQQSQSIDKQLNSIFQQLLLQLQWLLIIFLLLAWRLYRLYYGIRPQLKPVRPSPGFN